MTSDNRQIALTAAVAFTLGPGTTLRNGENSVLRIAAKFEKYLTDGEVPE